MTHDSLSSATANIKVTTQINSYECGAQVCVCVMYMTVYHQLTVKTFTSKSPHDMRFVLLHMCVFLCVCVCVCVCVCERDGRDYVKRNAESKNRCLCPSIHPESNPG